MISLASSVLPLPHPVLRPKPLLQICLFYLVLRGLDTVEDDPSIPDDVKQPILRSFHKRLTEPGWTFNGNRLGEKDRQLLVEFNVVIEEMQHLDPQCVPFFSRNPLSS